MAPCTQFQPQLRPSTKTIMIGIGSEFQNGVSASFWNLTFENLVKLKTKTREGKTNIRTFLTVLV